MKTGHIPWCDLSVPDASSLKDFYKAVVGWGSEDVDMGGYSDFTMLNSDGEGVAGVCHAKGLNSKVPPQWIVYITVPDLESSLATAQDLGAEILDGPRSGFAILRDPAGAAFALYQAAE